VSGGLLPPAAATQSCGTSGKHGRKCYHAISNLTLAEGYSVLLLSRAAVKHARHQLPLSSCRQVKLADSSVQSYGGLTTCTDYHLIRKDESVVDSVFMHDKYASPGAAGDESAMVVFTGVIWVFVQRPCVLIMARLARISTNRCVAHRTSRLVTGG